MHIFLEKPNLVSCPKCGHLILSHTVCDFCGYYRGREVIDVLAKLEKKERKKREREMKAVEKEERGKVREKPLTWEKLNKK